MPAIAGDPHFVRFGGFALDLRSGELTKNDNRLLLPEQPFRILALLVRSPGRQHRAIVARRLPADVLGRRLEIQARATWKS